jgi:hypothetical protein
MRLAVAATWGGFCPALAAVRIAYRTIEATTAAGGPLPVTSAITMSQRSGSIAKQS